LPKSAAPGAEPRHRQETFLFFGSAPVRISSFDPASPAWQKGAGCATQPVDGLHVLHGPQSSAGPATQLPPPSQTSWEHRSASVSQGVPAASIVSTQRPPLQAPVSHTASPHGAVLFTCAQAPAPLQASSVQGLPSSGHGAVLFACAQTPVPVQASSVHGLPSSGHELPAAATVQIEGKPVHVQQVSTMQPALQPSPSDRLASSQVSPGSTTPLPQAKVAVRTPVAGPVSCMQARSWSQSTNVPANVAPPGAIVPWMTAWTGSQLTPPFGSSEQQVVSRSRTNAPVAESIVPAYPVSVTSLAPRWVITVSTAMEPNCESNVMVHRPLASICAAAGGTMAIRITSTDPS
jgi:hypothetical protein